jgi:hypothetical protein
MHCSRGEKRFETASAGRTARFFPRAGIKNIQKNPASSLSCIGISRLFSGNGARLSNKTSPDGCGVPAKKAGRPHPRINGFAVIAGEAAPEFIIGPRFARTRWPRL